MSVSGPHRPPAGPSDPPARERRPWGGISRAQIVAAALEITRRDGLGAHGRAAGDGPGALPRLRAAEPHLHEITTAEVFDTELDMLIRAVEAEARTRR